MPDRRLQWFKVLSTILADNRISFNGRINMYLCTYVRNWDFIGCWINAWTLPVSESVYCYILDARYLILDTGYWSERSGDPDLPGILDVRWWLRAGALIQNPNSKILVTPHLRDSGTLLSFFFCLINPVTLFLFAKKLHNYLFA